MEFWVKARTGKIVTMALLCVAGAVAQPFTYRAQHAHVHRGGSGSLEITENGISFREQGKHKEHSRQWKYSDIQQLELSPTGLTILTYEDGKWEVGRDRQYRFNNLPEDFTKQVYPFFRRTLDQRFIAEVADPDVKPLWQAPAKLMAGLNGTHGVLIVGDDRIVFLGDAAKVSQTWRYSDIENISNSGPFELSINTQQHGGIWNGNWREFRFQMKEPLSEDKYNDLWRRLNRPFVLKSLQVLPDATGNLSTVPNHRAEY